MQEIMEDRTMRAKARLKSIFLLSLSVVCLIGKNETVNAMEVNEWGFIEHGIPQGIETETEIINGKESSQYKYSYNDMGLVIRKDCWSMDGQKKYSTDTFQYDDKGNLIQEINYDSFGEIWNVDIYKYNEKGQKIEQGIILDDGRYLQDYLFLYEGNKMLIWQSCYEKVVEYKEYDASGKIIAWQSVEDPDYPKRTEYSYDEKGRLVKVVYMTTHEKKYDRKNIYEYTYDAFDNIETENEYKSLENGGPVFFCGSRSFIKQYDEFGRLVRIGTLGFDGTFSGYVYTY